MKPVLSFALALLLAACVFPLQADDPGETASEPGLFSYQAPPGWKVVAVAMSKYKVAMGPAEGGFAPNINVVSEDDSGSLEKYVEMNKTAIKSSPVFTSVTFTSQSPFEGADGAKGIRLVVMDTLGKANMQQIFYFFDGPKSKLVVTASCLATRNAEFTPLFDASLKTFSPH